MANPPFLDRSSDIIHSILPHRIMHGKFIHLGCLIEGSTPALQNFVKRSIGGSIFYGSLSASGCGTLTEKLSSRVTIPRDTTSQATL